MCKKFKFQAEIKPSDRGGAFVIFPYDVEQVFGKKRVKVKTTIDGVPYRGSLVRMGGQDHILGILKEIRERIGKNIGDTIAIQLEEDTDPRIVIIPLDMKKALSKSQEANRFFQQLAYSNKRKYVQWVENAKNIGTRQRRILKAIEMLEIKQKL
jgi:hypothetical protein